jgi:hypothetical protein
MLTLLRRRMFQRAALGKETPLYCVLVLIGFQFLSGFQFVQALENSR